VGLSPDTTAALILHVTPLGPQHVHTDITGGRADERRTLRASHMQRMGVRPGPGVVSAST
jgi:hypothetical protein